MTEQPVPWSDFHKQYIDGSVDGDLPMTRLSEMFNVNHFIVSQVNPHVVPFLLKDEGPNGHTEHESTGWLQIMTHLAKDEILHRMTVLSELGVFPNSLTKFASIMNQKYSGDITIYPEIQYSNVPRMLENPTTEFMLQACMSGERATWPKLGRVRNHVAIELALDSAVQKMRARVALSHNHVDMRSRTRHSLNSFDSNSGQGRTNRNRRNSYSHEFEQTKRARRNSSLWLKTGLRRSRSALSLEQPLSIQEMHLAAATRAMDEWDDSHQKHHLSNAGDGPPVLRTPIDNGNEHQYPWDSQPGPHPGRRASWGPSSVWPDQHGNFSSRPRRFSWSSVPPRRTLSSSSHSLQSVHSTDHSSPSQLDPWAKPMSPLHHRLKMTPTNSDRYFDSTLY